MDSKIKNKGVFKEFKRSAIAEMRTVEDHDISCFRVYGKIEHETTDAVSISEADLKAGSPKLGDMIARNPKNHRDQWLVAEQYFKDNFEAY